MIPNKIIIHHSLTHDSGTVSWQAIRRYHQNTLHWLDVGYHFGIELIDERYEILAGRMMTETGAHTLGQNDNSIGICCIGNFDEIEPGPEQLTLCLRLTRTLMKVFNIPTAQVFGHREFADYKTCPGSKFDMVKFRKLLKE